MPGNVLPWSDASCEEIDAHLTRLAESHVERLHVRLGALLEVAPEHVFGGDSAGRAATLRWLATSRPLGQLQTLAHLLNRGLVVCTSCTGNDWEAEVLDWNASDVSRVESSDVVEALDGDLKSFEDELAALSVEALPQTLIDAL